jgi:hypothetical protein
MFFIVCASVIFLSFPVFHRQVNGNSGECSKWFSSKPQLAQESNLTNSPSNNTRDNTTSEIGRASNAKLGVCFFHALLSFR